MAKKLRAELRAPKPPVRMVQQPHGGAIRVGGTGAGGRPKDAWKQEMRDLRDAGLRAAKAKKILADPDHPAWLGALKFVHEAAEGRPAQSVDLTSKGEALPGVILLPAERPDRD